MKEQAKPWWSNLNIYCGTANCGFHRWSHDIEQINTEGVIENGNNIPVKVVACSAHLLDKPLRIDTERGTCNLKISEMPAGKFLDYVKENKSIK